MTGWVGQPLRRFDVGPLLTGHGRFVADLASDCAYLRFVRSPMARARIVGISVPDGAAVFTAEDLASVHPIRAYIDHADFVAVDQPVLARESVKHVGEAIAVVVADSLEEAEDLAELVFVDLDPLQPVMDLDDALTPDAERVHDHVPGNVVIDVSRQTDNVEHVFSEAAEIVEVDIRSHRESAAPIETRGSCAVFDKRTGRITLTASTQSPHVIRTAIADAVGMPEAELRVVAPDLGGAFGQKMNLCPEDIVTVWLARHLRRSVAWIEDRRENLMSSYHSRDHRYIARAAFNEEARMIGLEADIRTNVGAYSCYPMTFAFEALLALRELPGLYNVREYKARARAVVTDACPIAPNRGVSRPVITLTLDRLMDVAAKRFGLDPVEIRRRNLQTTFPFTSVTDIVYDAGSYVESLEKAAAAVDTEAFRSRQLEARREGRYLGIGFSVFAERTGAGTPVFAGRGLHVTPGFETAELTMDPSGSIEARISLSPHGQGLQTSLAQLIADEVGVTPDVVRVVHGDTDRTPYGWGTWASRSMVLAGGACKLAGAELHERLAAIAAGLLEAAVDDVVLEDGRATIRGTDIGVDLSELARISYHQSEKLSPGTQPGSLVTRATYSPSGTFSNSCHVVTVEVDPATGNVDIERYIVVEDAGVLINPRIAEGQIRGGVAQGIGGALYEEVVYDDDGNILTTSLADYLIPSLSDVPPIEVHHLHTPTDSSLTGAKGLGEGGTIGAPAAILNAISDALSPLDVEVFESPATPERIRSLVRAAGDKL